MTYTFINGEFFEDSEAMISAADRGFRFGDSVFETMRVVGGEVFQFDFHHNRLRKGLKILEIDYSNFTQDCHAVIAKNNVKDGFMRCQVSRGVGSVGYSSTASEPTVVINTLPHKQPDFAPIKLQVADYRVVPSECFPRGFKSGQSLGYSMVMNKAKSQGFYDALMLNTRGEIAETAASNIFWIAGRKLYTPSVKTDCVEGSVRDRIKQYFEVLEVEEKIEVLKTADSVFITNVGHLIKPVMKIDGIGKYPSEESKIYLGVRELLRRSINI